MELVDKEINVLHNIRYMAEGYGLCALEKMIPADIPVILVCGQVTDTEADFLKQIMHKCCIIGVGETAIFLLDRKITVDFIAFTNDTAYEIFEKNEVWQMVPLLTNTEIPTAIFESHHGKKFFFASGNQIENLIFYKALEKCNVRYQYNKLWEMQGNDAKSWLINLVDFMGASYTLWMEGKEKEESAVELYERTLYRCSFDISNPGLLSYFKIASQTEKVVSWLIPLFDGNGREYFMEAYNNLAFEFRKIKEIVLESIRLYEELYRMAGHDTVIKSELDELVARLNDNTASLETMGTISYLLNLSEKLCIPRDNREKCNEIAEIALDALDRYKKLVVVLGKITAGFLEMESVNTETEAFCPKEESKIRNLLLLCCSSQYNVLPYFTKGLKEGFQRLGIVTYQYILGEGRDDVERIYAEGYNHFQNTVGYEYVLDMNGAMTELERYDYVSGSIRKIFDNVNSKLLLMVVDHPLQIAYRMFFMYHSYVVLLADDNWVKYAKNHMKDVEYPFFLPLGGFEQKEKKIISLRKRENKIVFFGGYSDLSEKEKQINEHKYGSVMKRIIELLEKNTEMTIEDAVNRVEAENMSAYTIQCIVYQPEVFQIINDYIRQFYRQKVVHNLICSGLPIDIYGWEDVPGYEEYSNVTFKKAVPFGEMLEICGRVRFVLNVQPWIKSGTQERVFNAMLSGAIAVTDATDYLREKTTDRTNILLYELSESESLPSKIKYYMEHEDEAEQIAKNGYALAKKHHTWSSRAEEIVKILEERARQYADY